MRRLPRIIRLPGGFVIEVKKTRLPADEWGSWMYSLEAKLGVIKISNKADLPRQWRTLAHELLHAATDYEHFIEEAVARPLETEMGRTMQELSDED